MSVTAPVHLLLIWRPDREGNAELATALGSLRVSAEGASLLARQSALAADLHDEATGEYCGAVDAGGVVVWRDGPEPRASGLPACDFPSPALLDLRGAHRAIEVAAAAWSLRLANEREAENPHHAEFWRKKGASK